MDVLGKGIDIIVFVLILVIVPLLWLASKQDVVITRIAQDATIDLVEDISFRGYISAEIYELYLEKLRMTGLIYTVEIEGSSTAESTDEIIETINGGEYFFFSQGENVAITVERVSESPGDMLSASVLRRKGINYFRIGRKITGGRSVYETLSSYHSVCNSSGIRDECCGIKQFAA